MIVVNKEPHFTRAEVVEAVRAEIQNTGRGAFRPSELPEIAGDALKHYAEAASRAGERFETGSR